MEEEATTVKIISVKKESSFSECKHFDEFMSAQKGIIQKAIDENKWYLSQKAGYDVGWSKAEEDFIDNYLIKIAKEFRETFCGKICKDRENCNWQEYVA